MITIGKSGKMIFERISLENLKNPMCIKKRLIQIGIDPICSECGWDYKEDRLWLLLPEEIRNRCIPVQLDHIDGNPNNNKLENLRFLCPNCHALQLTSFRPKTKTGGRMYRRIEVYDGPVIENNKGSSKLSIKEVIEIKEKYKSQNQTVEELSVEYKISQCAITRILTGKCWA